MADALTQTAAAPAETTDASQLMEQLMKTLEPEQNRLSEILGKDEEQFNPLKGAILGLAEEVLKGHIVGENILKAINGAIAHLDKLLSDQVNAIIHHPDFLEMESKWRGLDYLIKTTPRDEKLKISVLSISKQELGKTLEKFDSETGQEGWDQSPIFRKVFAKRLDMPGGEPFGAMVGDYYFDNTAPDLNLLARMGRVCGAAHMPFITASSPKMVGVKSWQNIPDVASLAAKMGTADYTQWKALRQSDDSRYLALTVPRFLARIPYGASTAPVENFSFEEDLRPDEQSADSLEPTHDKYVWANAAYAMAHNIGRSFADTGFCTRIRGFEDEDGGQGGGLIEDLPVHTFPTTDGGIDAKCPTEIGITMQKEAELSNLGFMPLSHMAGSNSAAFVGGQTVQAPAKYSTIEATENAQLSARLPYVFMVSRFAHYLKQMVYRWVGTNKQRTQLETELNDWIMSYCTAENSHKDEKNRKPLQEARIEVLEIPGRPGFYEARAFLRPHIQLEGVELKLGVVSKVPQK